MYDFHSPKQKTAIGRQETEPRPSNIIRIDQNLLETRLDRLNREIRRRTRVVESFPNGNSALMLVCARIHYVTANEWSTRRYLDMSRLGDSLV